ncbi:thioesterase family protein [Bailinhaonella thermotolerans]|uniref:Thioesterase family protein n=1 Tax=Bailinhaonella thermotolerans TaxID=1070861 RepID=A0A3A4ALN9_9ACTN|nr:thioesterase family protein [Bailinhaonella thermotolerans]RJL22071.1 thioesterase family protein [Bailinhaonella thermotolerans]
MAHFAAATAVRHRDGGPEFDVELDPQWAIGEKLHGGYLLAVLGRAAGAVTPDHPHVTAVSATYVTPPEPGPAVARVEVLRSGKTLTQVRAGLLQEGRSRVEALFTMGRLTDEDPHWTDLPPVKATPEENCFLSPEDPPGAGLRVPLMSVVELRLDPEHLGFALGKPSNRGLLTAWMRLADGSGWDPLSLLVALDALPPVTYDLGIPGWAPTIQLTAYVRRLPAAGPILVSQKAGEVGGDRMDEVCHAWDSKGRLVGQATQYAAVRVPA